MKKISRMENALEMTKSYKRKAESYEGKMIMSEENVGSLLLYRDRFDDLHKSYGEVLQGYKKTVGSLVIP